MTLFCKSFWKFLSKRPNCIDHYFICKSNKRVKHLRGVNTFYRHSKWQDDKVGRQAQNSQFDVRLIGTYPICCWCLIINFLTFLIKIERNLVNIPERSLSKCRACIRCVIFFFRAIFRYAARCKSSVIM